MLTGAALGKVAFTFPMKIVFANLRQSSKSILAGV
jgi:hypothetical protein